MRACSQDKGRQWIRSRSLNIGEPIDECRCGAWAASSIHSAITGKSDARLNKSLTPGSSVAWTTWRGAVAVAVAVVAFCVPARAGTFRECAERAYAQAVAASQEWQRGLRDLTVKVRPDFAALASLAMEQQLARIDRRQAQFRFVLRTDVRRVHTGEGLASFRNFDWTEADGEVLRQQSTAYVAIERRVLELDRQSQARRDWPALHEYVKRSLGTSPAFQGLLKRVEAREGEIELLLKSCQPSR
jgi:hypothetical protein